MSSTYVRTNIENFITAELPAENLIDLTGAYSTLENLLNDSGLSEDDPWLGIEFIASPVIPITVNTDNTQGCYREEGTITLYVVEVGRLGVGGIILGRAETIINAFRGQRINDIIIEDVTPANFTAGTTLDLEGGYISASILIGYQYTENL